MKILLFEIPDDAGALAGWLEQQLMGLELRRLVLELEAVQRAVDGDNTGASTASGRIGGNSKQAPVGLGDESAELETSLGQELSLLESELGPKMTGILERGLGWLTASELRGLLKFPRMLIALQHRIFLEGGAYWNEVPISAEHQGMLQHLEGRIQEQLRQAGTTGSGGSEANRPQSEMTGSVQSERQASVFPNSDDAPQERRNAGRVLLALAAALLVLASGYAIYQAGSGATVVPKAGWGFNQPGLLAGSERSASEYLAALASAAKTWEKQPQDTVEELTQRLSEFRKGCDSILSAPHQALAVADREWLVERCRLWAGKIDGHLDDLKKGTKGFETVKADAQTTINALVKALTERSQSLKA